MLGIRISHRALRPRRLAAQSIDRYFGGTGDIDEVLAPPDAQLPLLEEAEEKNRTKMPVLAASKRTGTFDEIELGYSKRKAREEANRCLWCDLEVKSKYMALIRHVQTRHTVSSHCKNKK